MTPSQLGGGGSRWSLSRTFNVGVSVVGVVLFLFLAGEIWENVDANEILVVQAPKSGTLTWYTTPGIKWQGFGKLTSYPKRSIYEFACQEWQETEQTTVDEQTKKEVTVKVRECVPDKDTRIKIRFNDGGHAFMSGSIQYEMPADATNLTALHVRFGSPEAIQKQLVETVVNKSIYMVGPLMSSKESYAEKRNALISLVEDQVLNGVVQTNQRDDKTKDPITGTEKTVTVVDIVKGADGNPLRQEPGQLSAFGIKPFNFSIKDMPYDDIVEKQIQQQQQLTMQVQTSLAEARQAEQRAVTAAKNGEADAAKAKWDQEVIKAKEVTAAEQRLRVAELDAKAAEQGKRKAILEGEGEATKKQLVMNADGALAQKLDAWVKSQQFYADAIKGYQGNWVPQVVTGSGNGTQSAAGSGAAQLMEFFAVKAAKDLALDMNVSGASRTTQQRGAQTQQAQNQK